MVCFATLLFFTAELEFPQFYTTFSFCLGAFTSIVSGYIGMRVAVYTNVRTTKECAAHGIHEGFVVAYRGGQVLGFTLVGLALGVLHLLITAYRRLYLEEDESETLRVRELFELVAGYGLGGSTVALFGRVGGGIYTKAADVGSDIAGKNV